MNIQERLDENKKRQDVVNADIRFREAEETKTMKERLRVEESEAFKKQQLVDKLKRLIDEERAIRKEQADKVAKEKAVEAQYRDDELAAKEGPIPYCAGDVSTALHHTGPKWEMMRRRIENAGLMALVDKAIEFGSEGNLDEDDFYGCPEGICGSYFEKCNIIDVMRVALTKARAELVACQKIGGTP